MSKINRRFITFNGPRTPIPTKTKWIIAMFCAVNLLLGVLFVSFMAYPFYRYQYNKHHNYAITCTVKDSEYKTIGALYAPTRVVVHSEDCEELHMSRPVDGTTQPQALGDLKPGRRVRFYLGEKKIGGYHYIVKYKVLN